MLNLKIKIKIEISLNFAYTRQRILFRYNQSRMKILMDLIFFIPLKTKRNIIALVRRAHDFAEINIKYFETSS